MTVVAAKHLMTPRRWLSVVGSLFVLLLAAIFFCAFFGTPVITWHDVFVARDPVAREILFEARLTRILLGVFVGAGLSVSGVAFQAMLRNPLADPYILGVSGGAALGAVLSVVLGLPFLMVSGVAFLFAVGSLFLIYFMARTRGQLPVHALLLTGVIFNSFAFAFVLLVNALASLGELHTILFLLVGQLEATRYDVLAWVGINTVVGVTILTIFSMKLNLVALGEDEATALGLKADTLRKIVFFSASLMVGASVSVAGLIGFVGLFVPHLTRLLFGGDHRLLVPASALGGGLFLILCDFAAHQLFSSLHFQTQLPVGVITALLGGPFFLFLMKRQTTVIRSS